MKANFKGIIMLVVMVAAIILAVSLLSPKDKSADKFDYSDLVECFENDVVYSFTVDGDSEITVQL